MSVELWMWVGFLLAALSVVWNDSIQTLGTYMNSNKGVIHWKHLWLGASTVLVFTIAYGWYVNGGDISYGRLEKIPPVPKIEWYHAMAPLVLLVLTRFGIPVSTSFLVLSVFSTTVVLEKMFMKSFVGLTLAAIVSFALWFALANLVKKASWRFDNLSPRAEFWARVAQAGSTALLWAMWLTHDMSNIAVFLPRQLPLWMLVIVLVVLVVGLGFIFRQNGGRIQHIVKSKTNTRFIVSATVVDLVYAGILYYFKIQSSIPMSTTWVFVGLLLGREVAIRTILTSKNGRKMLPMIVSDLSKLIFGALVSVGLAFAVQGQLSNIDDVIGQMSTPFLVLCAGLLAFMVVGGLWAITRHHEEHGPEPQTGSTLP